MKKTNKSVEANTNKPTNKNNELVLFSLYK